MSYIKYSKYNALIKLNKHAKVNLMNTIQWSKYNMTKSWNQYPLKSSSRASTLIVHLTGNKEYNRAFYFLKKREKRKERNSLVSLSSTNATNRPRDSHVEAIENLESRFPRSRFSRTSSKQPPWSPPAWVSRIPINERVCLRRLEIVPFCLVTDRSG